MSSWWPTTESFSFFGLIPPSLFLVGWKWHGSWMIHVDYDVDHWPLLMSILESMRVREESNGKGEESNGLDWGFCRIEWCGLFLWNCSSVLRCYCLFVLWLITIIIDIVSLQHPHIWKCGLWFKTKVTKVLVIKPNRSDFMWASSLFLLVQDMLKSMRCHYLQHYLRIVELFSFFFEIIRIVKLEL